MATEKLKVFTNTASSVSTSAITNVVIKTTSSSEQAVLKTISYEAVDPKYPVTATLTNGNANLTTPKTTLKTVKNSDTLSGSQIVDVSSTVNIKFDTGADQVTNGYTDARYFAGNNAGIFKWADGTGTPRDPSVTTTFTDTVGDFTSVRTGSLTKPASSAFGLILDANNSPTSSPAIAAGDKVYFAMESNAVKAFNAAGALITWNTGGGNANNDSFDFNANTFGSCTDGTYIYAKSMNNDTALMRRSIVGNVEVQITLSQSIIAQNGNQGGFTLYHDGYIYIHGTATIGDVFKINVTTGAVQTLTGCGIGGYSAGAIVTKRADGEFYIIEVGTGADKNNIIKLSDFTRSPSVTMYSLGTSTEYGNLGMEVAPGIGVFFYNSVMVYIDVNTMTANTTQMQTSSYFASGYLEPASNNDASSIANIPIHLIAGATTARAVTHKVYADGVLIEGVA